MIELIREGYLIKGTTDIEQAKRELGRAHASAVKSYVPGRYRKVPGQWSNFNLYDGTGPGSFEAVIAYLEEK